MKKRKLGTEKEKKKENTVASAPVRSNTSYLTLQAAVRCITTIRFCSPVAPSVGLGLAVLDAPCSCEPSLVPACSAAGGSLAADEDER